MIASLLLPSRALVCAYLTTYREEAYNLGKIERIVADGVEDQILELVDHVQQLLSQRCHVCGVPMGMPCLACCCPFNLEGSLSRRGSVCCGTWNRLPSVPARAPRLRSAFVWS